ncbi:MAG: LOG family protein [Muribaculaceae bacterium]|nr:LOG family protein [Muribaculaceae bacterium]
MKKVAIYCSSQEGLPKEIEDGARLIASAIGKCNGVLVYGGVNAGLMHTVAAAAKDSGAQVTGVVPQVFEHRADPLCDQVLLTEDLNHRKSKMIEMADIFVVLPGGIGTIDEWVSTLSHIMVQERVDPSADKPIMVWNAGDMYSGMVSQLSATNASVYARGRRVDRSLIYPTAKALASALLDMQK